MVHDAWVEVDLAALRHNFRQVRSAVPDRTKVLAVVKGNGFGHGYVEPAKAFLDAGADALAVTRIDEALTLRAAGVYAPITVFAPIQIENAEAALEADLEVTVCTAELAEALSVVAKRAGKTSRVWVKVDSGMGRLGVLPHEVRGLLEKIAQTPNLQAAGVYTHFATAMEKDLSATRRQFSLFQQVLRELQADGIDYGLASAANSAAVLRLPESHLDMVRPGTLLYGQYPSAHVPHTLDLKPTWKLKARICQVRDLPKGASVGYGGECVTNRPTRTAVVSIGYADGYSLAPDGPMYRQSLIKFALRKARRAHAMIVHGQRAPILGRVSMQLSVIDVTGIDGVAVGDEVTIPTMRIPTSPLIPRIYLHPQRA